MAEPDGNETVSDIKRATQTPLVAPSIPPEHEGDEGGEEEGGEEVDE